MEPLGPVINSTNGGVDEKSAPQKPFDPTKQNAEIESMARLGICNEAIAAHCGITVDALAQACGAKINLTKQESNLRVLQSLFDMATSGRNLSATLFWIKTHCGHLLPAEKDDLPKAKGSKSGDKTEWDPNDPNDRVIFSVYNNDGEPNADY
jgi:hypothetical protein